MVIINLKTESQIVNRKPHPKVTKLKSTSPFPGLAQTGTEQLGQGATLLGWPKSIYYNTEKIQRPIVSYKFYLVHRVEVSDYIRPCNILLPRG